MKNLRKNEQANLFGFETEKERKAERYYGSPLNKFANHYCTHKMVVNNIDMATFRYNYSKGKVRIIESKRKNESPMKDSQRKILEILSEQPGLEVFEVRGDSPYYDCVITNIKTGRKKIVLQKELIDWIEYKITLDI